MNRLMMKFALLAVGVLLLSACRHPEKKEFSFITSDADAGKRQIRTLPRLTSETEWMQLQHLPVMGGTISVWHEHTNKTTFENHLDHPITWKAVFPGSYTTISCNGELIPAVKETDILGNTYSYIELEVKPQKSCVVICEYPSL